MNNFDPFEDLRNFDGRRPPFAMSGTGSAAGRTDLFSDIPLVPGEGRRGRRGGPTPTTNTPSPLPTPVGGVPSLGDVPRAGRRAAAAPVAAAAPTPFASPVAASAPAPAPEEDEDPFAFLDPDHGRSRGGAAAAAAAEGPSPGAATVNVVPLSVEMAKRREEELHLRASLAALDIQINDTNTKMETAEIKLEAELTQLDAGLIEKTERVGMEKFRLEEAESEYKDRINVALDEIRLATDKKCSQAEEEAHKQQTASCNKRLKELQAELHRVQAATVELREYAKLAAEEHPYQKEGIFAALAMAKADFDEDHSSDGLAQGTDVAEYLSDFAARYIRRLCDAHVEHVDKKLVDVVHRETMEVASDAQQERRKTAVVDAQGRKETYALHVQDTLSAYRVFLDERGAANRAKLDELYDRMKATSTQLRSDAQAHLEHLLLEVTAKLQHTTDQFEKRSAAIQQDHDTHVRAVVAGDEEMATLKRREVESRCATTAKVLRQLHQSQLSSLQEELVKIQTNGNRHAKEGFDALLKDAERSNELSIDGLRKRVLELRGVIEGFHRGEESRAQRGVRHFEVLEAADQTVQSKVLLSSVRQRQGEMHEIRQRTHTLCEELLHGLTSEVDSLRERRAMQQMHQSRIDFARTAWEREHRAALAAGHLLDGPIVASSDVTAAHMQPTTVYVDPGLSTTTSVVESLVAQLQKCQEAHTRVQQERRSQTSSHEDHRIRQHRSLQERCEGWRAVVASYALLMDDQARTTAHQWAGVKEEAQMEAEEQHLEQEQERCARRRTALDKEAEECRAANAAVISAYQRQRAQLRKLSAQQVELSHGLAAVSHMAARETSRQVSAAEPIVKAPAVVASPAPAAAVDATPPRAEPARHAAAPPGVLSSADSASNRSSPHRRTKQRSASLPTSSGVGVNTRWIGTPSPKSHRVDADASHSAPTLHTPKKRSTQAQIATSMYASRSGESSDESPSTSMTPSSDLRLGPNLSGLSAGSYASLTFIDLLTLMDSSASGSNS